MDGPFVLDVERIAHRLREIHRIHHVRQLQNRRQSKARRERGDDKTDRCLPPGQQCEWQHKIEQHIHRAKAPEDDLVTALHLGVFKRVAVLAGEIHLEIANQ